MPKLHLRLRSLLLLGTVIAAACSNGKGDTPFEPARLVLAVNTAVVEPSTAVPIPPLDYTRFAIDRFGGVYRVTTPADVPFAFDLMSWNEGAAGFATVAIAHVGDGGATPAGGLESLARAGIAPAGMGLWGDSGWLSASGDGFARLTVQGIIARDQVLAVRSEAGGTAIVVIAIGERSAINQLERTVPVNPFVASRATIYSSDAWRFGLPTIAVSGDRTTIVTYEGDRQLGMAWNHYELRMQHDRVSGAVTGGGTVESGVDSGNWRDHEIAAHYNVLAVSRSEVDRVRIKLSYDRGATFGQEVEIGQHQGPSFDQTRLVQAAMALDYSLAVAWWQGTPAGNSLDLMLCEGRPVAFDVNGSPTWFGFDPPQVVHSMPHNSSPLLTGITWSEGGDLVIGYGASWFGTTSRGFWTSTTEFRCAVRRYGQPLVDRPVDVEEMVGYDPSVAVLGQGASLRIFYAYEMRGGVRLATSDDGGATFAIGSPFGEPGAHNPTVFARQNGAATRVDVLYLANDALGRELHHARWQDWGTAPREDYRLTAAAMVPTPYQPGRPTLWGYTGPLDFGLRTTQVSWLGYDAVLDGNQIVAVIDEVTQDAAYLCMAMFTPGVNGNAMTGIFSSPGFRPAVPPPLAPGMTQPMPAVDSAHSHQLQLVRID